MRFVFQAFPFRLRSFRASGMLFKFGQFYLCRKVFQYLDQLGECHPLKYKPMVIINSDFHPRINGRNFIGNVVTRKLLFNDIDAMHSTQSGFDDRHDDIRHQGDTKAKQCGTGVTQGVDF